MARVAFIVDDEFEDSEFRVPYDRVREAGHDAIIVGREAGKALTGKRGKEVITTELSARDALADDFDALVIPGGYSPDHLRVDPHVVDFVHDFFEAIKTVAAVCHGPSLLIEAEAVEGRTVTSWPSIKTDLLNAGAHWVDEEVVEDGHLVTSRKPMDLYAFGEAILRQLEGRIPERITPLMPPEGEGVEPLH